MTLHGVRQIGRASAYGIWTAPQSGDGAFSGSFHQNFSRQMNSYYKNYADSLFDEINSQAADCFRNVNFEKFERYRALIREMVGEVVNNAFTVSRESVLDRFGKQRVYLTVGTIDEKLEQLASDLLKQNIERIEFISRIDEIRGLVMDLLL